MEDVMDIALDVDVVGDVVMEKLETMMADEVGYVFRTAGNEIIDGEDGVTLSEEAVAQMRAEKTRTPCYYADDIFSHLPLRDRHCNR
jgi:hypothetical protein